VQFAVSDEQERRYLTLLIFSPVVQL